MLSFWEKRSYIEYDYLIIGGGIVGLSAAIELKEKEPAARVLLLERGLFPSGASTKNAGFACFGSLTELLSDMKTMSEEATIELLLERWRGLQKLRSRLGEEKIGFHCYGGYELIGESELPCLDELERVNELLWPVFNALVFEEEKELIKEFGFNKKRVATVVKNQYEGQIDTGKMMKSLTAYAHQCGVDIITGAEVSQIEENQKEVRVHVPNPVYGDSISFKAAKVGVCTNAFTQRLFPEVTLKPGRGIVLVTKPIKNLKFKGVFHMDEGFYYFRNFGQRIILGGGRNLDFETETTDQFEINEAILDNLQSKLKDVILPKQKFEIEHTWAGIMAFGKSKLPIVRQYSDRVVMGVRLGGMGVAIGSNLGEQVADMLLEK
jgi:gamma-glutamylputrescine oxidase